MKLLQSQTDVSDNQKLVIYFDYSCESDIPVLLENWQRYKLLQDVNLLIPSIVDDCTKDKDSSDQLKNDHQRIYIETLQQKVTVTKNYMAENPDWFHANMQSDMSDRPSSRPTSPPMNKASQQLPVVTVEYNRDRRHSDVTGVANHVEADAVKKSSSNHNTRSPVPTLSRHRQHKMDSDRHSIVSSYTSSVEDLDHDIDFILNPSLPSRVSSIVVNGSIGNKAKFMTAPQALIDLLPTSLPRLPLSSDTNLQDYAEAGKEDNALDISYTGQKVSQ